MGGLKGAKMRGKAWGSVCMCIRRRADRTGALMRASGLGGGFQAAAFDQSGHFSRFCQVQSFWCVSL